ncbi:MAG: helix-turn-helix domain-containing protein [Oscillospiraceae bacterium]|nr:helix-turn-helix domain-containing protein [Oscillospiraceae bacterium]
MNLRERDQEIGRKIKQYRKGKMTQQELAEKISKTESSIRKYEKGLVTIPLDVLEKIASTLEVTPFDLMGFEYWDQKHADEVKVAAMEVSFNSYLESLGFSVEPKVIEWEYENPNETDPAEKVQNPKKWEYILSKDGKEAIFTQVQFTELKEKAREAAKEAIDARFYKMVLEQQK